MTKERQMGLQLALLLRMVYTDVDINLCRAQNM